eukprot:18084-Heterococcus_DN1.PRE.1
MHSSTCSQIIAQHTTSSTMSGIGSGTAGLITAAKAPPQCHLSGPRTYYNRCWGGCRTGAKQSMSIWTRTKAVESTVCERYRRR